MSGVWKDEDIRQKLGRKLHLKEGEGEGAVKQYGTC